MYFPCPRKLNFVFLMIAVTQFFSCAFAQQHPLSPAVGLVAVPDAHVAEKAPVECVNPFIGTGGHGHTYPGATVPFGMVQLSPDTFNEGWDWCSGYHWSDSSIMGFSHTHLSGTGCGDLGDILFAPTTGLVKLVPGFREKPEEGYRSRFSHKDEKASPGFYSVMLQTYNTQAELTATEHVGIHRYTFPAHQDGNVIIDLAHGIQDKPINLELHIVDDHTVTGMRRSKGWAKDQYVFFVAEFSKPFKSFGATTDDLALQPGVRDAQGTKVKGWLTFANVDGKPLIAKVALSTTSVDGAKTNLRSEMPGWDFDKTRQQAREIWSRNLDKILVQGVALKDRETFYTALYHALVAPTLISDVNGSYRGSDLLVHDQSDPLRNYSTFSLWDTFRAEHPLLTILDPQRVTEMLDSFKVQAEFHKDNTLPIWPLYANETYCMIGYHSFPVIAEANKKGIKSKHLQTLIDLMINNTKVNDWWADKGYMPADKERESVSKTLEFAYDDWTLAQLAKSLGKQDQYEKYMKRSEAYKNVFDSETGFMRGRLSDGSWRKPFDPTSVTDPNKYRDFTEANAWQYTFFVPHDVQGLINLFGGRDKFVKKLDEMFEHKGVVQETADLDVSGLIGQYAHGNEPSHHVAYLYDYAGAPWKTQAHIKQICQELYNSSPEGLCGNEDCGQMSAWYVFSALGFYPVNPVDATYAIGVPSFPSATITLANGRKFNVLAKNLSPKFQYIEKALLNGKELSKVYITHEQLMNGGTLEFIMTDKPGSKWGTDPQAAPPSMSSARH